MHIGPQGATRLLAVVASALLSACGQPVETSVAEKLPDTPIFYVDAAAGSDTNHGRTAKAPFKTLNRAAGAVKPGWTVQVMSGTYTSDGTENPLTVSVSGTPGAWITFTAASGQHPVIQIPRGASAGIHLFGVSYVIIDGFQIIGQNTTITPPEAAANDGTQAFLNHNCVYIDGVGYADVHPPVPHDIIIRNSILHDCPAAGIEINAADAITIEHNRVYNNSWWTVDDSMHTQSALGVNDVKGVPDTGRTYVANNIVHDNGGRGIHLYRSEHVDVVNNTAWNNMLSSSTYIQSGEIDALDSTDVNVVNNVAVNLVGKDVTYDDGNHYDYNLWDGARVPFKWGHDIAGKANLTDPGGGNFAPRAGSPALRSGTNVLAPADDFLGNSRPAGAIDRGAIQASQ